jgi:hypothetical protein
MVDGIKVIAEKEFSFLLDEAKIVQTKSYFGTSFNVVIPSAAQNSCG